MAEITAMIFVGKPRLCGHCLRDTGPLFKPNGGEIVCRLIVGAQAYFCNRECSAGSFRVRLYLRSPSQP